MCNCNKNAQVGKVRKTRKRRSASVAGVSITKPKEMLNLPTMASAGVTAYGIAKMAEGATGDEYAMLRSKEGATQLSIGGLVVAFLTPGKGNISKVIRGVGAGAALHGIKVMATDKDWMGNDVTFEKTADVAGYPFIPGGYARPGRPGATAVPSGNGVQYM